MLFFSLWIISHFGELTQKTPKTQHTVGVGIFQAVSGVFFSFGFCFLFKKDICTFLQVTNHVTHVRGIIESHDLQIT